MTIECPNCGGEAEDHTDSRGGGNVYCLDGCGYEEEIPAGTRPRKKPEWKPIKKPERMPPKSKATRKK